MNKPIRTDYAKPLCAEQAQQVTIRRHVGESFSDYVIRYVDIYVTEKPTKCSYCGSDVVSRYCTYCGGLR
jgi:hypothetical protein